MYTLVHPQESCIRILKIQIYAFYVLTHKYIYCRRVEYNSTCTFLQGLTIIDNDYENKLQIYKIKIFTLTLKICKCTASTTSKIHVLYIE